MSTLSALRRRDLESNVRLAARMAMRRGLISREEMRTVQRAVDHDECCSELCEDLNFAMQTSAAGTSALAGAGILQWLLDNWPQIMQMIQQLIALFGV